MIRSSSRKALIALSASAFAAATFAMASPAQASRPSATEAAPVAIAEGSSDVGIQTSADCVYYLRAVGYAVGAQRTQNCNTGASGDTWSYAFCYGGLVAGGVSEYHAGNACRLAA